MIEKMFQFNYFLTLLLGNAIRIQTFALVNLTSVRSIDYVYAE